MRAKAYNNTKDVNSRVIGLINLIYSILCYIFGSLCSLSGLKLEFSGAYNHMWVVRKGEIIEIKADRQPIGNCDNPLPFTTQSFDLGKDDVFYVFSDGYVDQFGGGKGKKLKPKKFRSIVLGVTDKPMADQKELLDEALPKWRGDLEQVDDVCMIGVRV